MITTNADLAIFAATMALALYGLFHLLDAGARFIGRHRRPRP